MKQYHITVYATVDDEGNVLGWDICEPGSEPVDSECAIFNEVTDEWESNTSESVTEGMWFQLERSLSTRLRWIGGPVKLEVEK